MRAFFLLILFIPFLAYNQNSLPPNGKLIDIGGYRLHIDVKGKGSPTVIFIAGATAFSFDWSLVTPEISKITRTVAYDRPALAWSDPGPMPRSLQQDVYELHKLLQNANVRPPYVLVGHSLGGMIARMFEKKYPDQVKGLVLVDATSENSTLFINNKVQRLRLLSQGRPIPPLKTSVDTFTKMPSQKDMDDFLKMVGQPTINAPFDKLSEKIQRERLWAMKQPKILLADNGNYWAEEFAEMYNDSAYSIGNKPLIVISSGQNNYPKSLGDSIRNDLINGKLRDQLKMADLSSDSKHIVTMNSPHEIHLTEPTLVINAIKEVIASIRSGEPLRK